MATIHDAFAAAAIISLFFLLVEARLARELDDWDHFDAVSERLSDAVLTEVERRAAGVNIAGEGREGPAETGGRGPWFSWIPGARVLLRTGPAVVFRVSRRDKDARRAAPCHRRHRLGIWTSL